jgi:hypothetical protein
MHATADEDVNADVDVDAEAESARAAGSGGPARAGRGEPDGLGFGPAIVLATLLAGAGVLHLVMAPLSSAGSGVEAAAFALAGWVQLALAALVLVRATGGAGRGSRFVLVTTVVVDTAFIAVWAASRTVGLPVGHRPGVVRPVGGPDVITVGLELGVVLLAALAYGRPDLFAGFGRQALALAAGLPVAALLVVSLVIVSPRNLPRDSGAAATSTADQRLAALERDRCDGVFNPRSYWTEAARAGVDTGAVPPTTVSDPLGGRGSPRLDQIVQKLSSESETEAGNVITALPDLDDREYEGFLYQLRRHNSTAGHGSPGDDTGHGGHLGPAPWVPMTDRAVCDKLVQDLAVARAAALTYPTAGDAEKAGWRKVTGYVPGLGAHYINIQHVDSVFEVGEPELLLYDGDGPDAHVVGLTYLVIQPGDTEPTQGFTGDNDHAHRHIGLCMRAGLVVGASTMTEAECAAVGGTKPPGGEAGWMTHAWVVPGCESPWGVFSAMSPILDGALPKASGRTAGGCEGSRARARYDLSPGGASAPGPPGPVETAAGAARR